MFMLWTCRKFLTTSVLRKFLTYLSMEDWHVKRVASWNKVYIIIIIISITIIIIIIIIIIIRHTFRTYVSQLLGSLWFYLCTM